MANVHDVASYVLQKCGPMTAMKMQKLVYYSQAWSVVWDERPLFPERIQAWANGPVVWELFDLHRGQYTVNEWSEGDPSELSDVERDTIDQVLHSYARLSARQLSHLTHSESPWRDARGSVPDTLPSNAEITVESLADYYGALDASSDASAVDDLDWGAWLASESTPNTDGEG